MNPLRATTANDDLFSSSNRENDQRLIQALAEYHELVDSGEPLDREALLEKYDDIQEELLGYLDCFDIIHSVAPQLQSGESIHSAGDLGQRSALGDFRIIREIGRGGMGIVYEAEQLSVGRRVALKVLPFATMLRSQQLERFRNEVRAAGSLNHPHIVAVYSVGNERGVHFYAMQLVEGYSLAEVISQIRDGQSLDEAAHGAPPSVAGDQETRPLAELATVHSLQPDLYWQSVARLGMQAAEALDHAHRCGVVHRDVKPANLLVSGGDQLWIADFGLARLGEDAGMTMTGDLPGTLRYMSPEQAAGDRAVIDHRTDIYSLGVTLYEMLTLRPAFLAQDRQQLLHDVTSSVPPTVHRIDERIPTDLATIVGKAMEPDAADRYANAESMAKDLRAFVERRPISARPPSPVARLHRWARRHFAVVIAAVLILASGLIGVSIAAAIVAQQRTVAQRHARQSEDNLQLALEALEETLAASVSGELVVDPHDQKRVELLKRGIAFYEQFAERNNVDPKQWPTYRLLLLNQRLGEASVPGTGHPADTDSVSRDAISQAEELVAMTQGDPMHVARLIHCIDDYGMFLSETGRFDEAREQSERAERIAKRLAAEHPDFAFNAFLRGKNLFNRSTWYALREEVDNAERYCREALPLLERAATSDPSDVLSALTLARCRYNLGMCFARRGQIESAEDAWQKTVADWRSLTLLQPLVSEYHSRAGATLSNLAALARDQGDFHECRQLAEEALTFQQQALQLEPVFPFAEEFLGIHYKQLSMALANLGEYQALADLVEPWFANVGNTPRARGFAAITLSECICLFPAEQLDEQLRLEVSNELAERALELLDECLSADEPTQTWSLADAYLQVGDHLATADLPAQARQAWQASLTLFTDLNSTATDEDVHQPEEMIDQLNSRLSQLESHSDDTEISPE